MLKESHLTVNYMLFSTRKKGPNLMRHFIISRRCQTEMKREVDIFPDISLEHFPPGKVCVQENNKPFGLGFLS